MLQGEGAAFSKWTVHVLGFIIRVREISHRECARRNILTKYAIKSHNAVPVSEKVMSAS